MWETLLKVWDFLVQIGEVVSPFALVLFTTFRWADLIEGRKNRKALAGYREAVEDMLESQQTMNMLLFTYIQHKEFKG